MNEERLLANQLNAVADIDGVVGFMKSMKRSGGAQEVKKIGINQNGFIMEQPGEKKPIEYEAVLMVPQTGVDMFRATYKNGAILASFRSGLDDPIELAKAGDMRIDTADWDAPILENNPVEITVKLKTTGYGATTRYGAIVGAAPAPTP